MQGCEELKKIIYKTVGNIELWEEVIQEFIKLTGASKGIITLRDRMTAELVFSQDTKHELSSPLLYGFSEAETESYIYHYAQFDPWTEIEKLYHPLYPYVFSKHLNIKTLQKSKFWEWLEPQGIGDAVVLDIGTSIHGWVAMNLFFPSENNKVKQAVLNLTREFQSAMSDAWRCGLAYRTKNNAPERLAFFIEQQSLPSLLLDDNATVILKNKKASDLFSQIDDVFIGGNNEFRIKNKNLRVLYNEAMLKLINTPFVSSEQSEVVIQDNNLLLKLILIEPPENVLGEEVGLRLITIENIVKCKYSSSSRVWDNPVLTKRERQLVELMANGGRVTDFINKYSLKKGTGHYHWTNVKKKLNVTDRSEIHVQHQIFLQNL